MARKKKIYYARTYRRIDMDWIKSIIFACVLIIPSFLLIALNIDFITDMISNITTTVLSKVIPIEYIQIRTTEYSILGEMKYVDLPTTFPEFPVVFWNLIACFLILLIMQFMKKNGRPLAIYAMFSMMIHVVSCIYFILAADAFPYTLGDYSDIYLKQQIGIWLTFIVLAGLILAFMGNREYLLKVATFLGIMLYSFIFGAVRYILFLFILHEFSVLYMALLFFVIGPMFDFSYFVGIYAIFINKNIKDYEFGDKKGVWKWS